MRLHLAVTSLALCGPWACSSTPELTLSATPAAVSPNGGTVTLTAAANDVSGNRLPGVPVTFAATAGNLSAAVVDTDQNGIATTAFTN